MQVKDATVAVKNKYEKKLKLHSYIKTTCYRYGSRLGVKSSSDKKSKN